MMLSRARPLALRTLTRQQRALSAAPQPVYEPHVVRTSVQIKTPTADAARRTIGCGVGGRIFQNHPPRRRRDARIARRCRRDARTTHAAAAPPE